MRKIYIATLLFLIMLCPAAGHAQTPISKNMADSYLQNCVSNQSPNMSVETQSIFCQCTVMQMQKSFYVEDMQALGAQDGRALAAQNKMLTHVYAPCMEFPVRDLIYNKCQSDMYQSKQGICSCLSNRMAQYVSTESQRLLTGILAQTPNLADPIAAITDTAEFKQKEKRIVLECIQ